MTGKLLFHGNNEAYLNEFGMQYLPSYWTSCAYDALRHSWNSARKFSNEKLQARMKVLVFPNAPLKKFAKENVSLGCRCDNLEWFLNVRPLRSAEDIKKRVKEYNEADLKAFVEQYLDSDHLEALKVTKIYERIIGERVPEPGFYQLQIQEKPKRA